MAALADTSILIDHLRGVAEARKLLQGAFERDQVVSALSLTRIELAIGTRHEEKRRTDGLVSTLRWLPVSGLVAEEAMSLARRYGRSHSGIDAVDYCVAAAARVHELDLWTLNVRHFPMFPRLQAPW